LALTEDARAAWLNMAQMWLQLAQRIERQEQENETVSFRHDTGPADESPEAG
jgi:hypothetical protein